MTNENIVSLAALHRHWIMADSIKVVLKQKMAPEQEAEALRQYGFEYFAFGQHASMLYRMQVWYSLLYVVIEGYQELGVKYEPLDAVLAQRDYVDLLRRYRNATFHYQANPITDKLIDFLEKADSESWIRELNKQLEAFLMQALPIAETIEKIGKTSIPEIPEGSKLGTLFRGHNPADG